MATKRQTFQNKLEIIFSLGISQKSERKKFFCYKFYPKNLSPHYKKYIIKREEDEEIC